ncbi:DUF4350 domain-containing protein [Flagellimonas lutaonensis]|uniref:DUF4350 domain-containing protein n=1 Tax=Flagellimonas lutaonensis TaxID=516051 RepID=A0A0D5YPA3_9FLAO|nr:DUF4350 domain-containing protein [Allomuricauda lutaonensis]AKA34042.1 hypothetical protein VC82_360 [Allomuricauda lutaonensis]
MGKKWGIYMVIAVAALGLLLLVEYSKPKKINWFPSYVAQHKIPYGTYVLNDLIHKKLGDSVVPVYTPPFEFLMQNDSVQGTYFFVNNSVNFGEAELDALLDWVSKGNKVFIASEGFEPQLLDTLNLEQISFYNGNDLNPVYHHRLVNKHLGRAQASFDKEYYTQVFNEVDTVNTVVLGEVFNDESLKNDPKINVVRQPFGKGQIILSLFPKAFTNYFILKDDNRAYTAGLLSYLKQGGRVYLDHHHKSGKSFYTSPMYIFLNTKEFKWAYYLVLIGTLFYVIFEGKRKQRAIPVVTPLTNQTLAFTRTIANMYFENKQQKELVEHKVAYFLEYIRTRLHLPTLDRDETFYRNLAARSNNSVDDVKNLFSLIDRLTKQQKVSDAELGHLNKRIEEFKAKIDGKH